MTQYLDTFKEMNDFMRNDGNLPAAPMHSVYVAGNALEDRVSKLEAIVKDLTPQESDLQGIIDRLNDENDQLREELRRLKDCK